MLIDHDAQRELQMKSLRNVRGLVEQIERQEADERRKQRRLLGGIVAAAIVVVAMIVTHLLTRDVPRKVVIDPAKLPPVQVQPQGIGPR